MAKAKLDHAMEFNGTTYPEDTEVEVDLDQTGWDESGKYAVATFPDGKILAIPDEHLRKWIVEEDGKGYWLKSRHDIDAGEIEVTVVDEKGTRTSIIPPRVEHL